MRKLIYTLVLIISVASCTSIGKLVERGEYNQAFNLAIKKLAGDKHKKTEHVQALEKAYAKLLQTSLREIDRLNAPSKPENWSKVLGLYEEIAMRQDKLEALLPLVSEDGYSAAFDMTDFSHQRAQAEDQTVIFYYNNALMLLDRAEQKNDRLSARKAYDQLRAIERYRSNYKDIRTQMDRAIELGMTMVKFNIYNDIWGVHASGIERGLYDMPVSRLNSFWIDYGFNHPLERADYLIEIELEHINFSPSLERTNTYQETKEILVRTDKVKEIRDSVEVWVEKEVYELVRASITETFREKTAELNGKIRIIDHRTGETIRSIPVNVFRDFKGYGAGYTGDKRALSDESRDKMDGFLEMFPSDFSMASDLTDAFKDVVMNEVNRAGLK